jgi:hypothetical protein
LNITRRSSCHVQQDRTPDGSDHPHIQHRGHKDDPLFKLRRVLRVGQERLDDTVLAKIFDRLRAADTDDEVAAAWIAVDLLRRMSPGTRS